MLVAGFNETDGDDVEQHNVPNAHKAALEHTISQLKTCSEGKRPAKVTCLQTANDHWKLVCKQL